MGLFTIHNCIASCRHPILEISVKLKLYYPFFFVSLMSKAMKC